MPIIESRAGAGPINLHYNDGGGNGRVVVLIHGWPLSSQAWSKQVPVLTDAGYRVVSYDRRGFGNSDKPGSGNDYDTFAGDLDAVLTGLELTDVTLVGFSMGGGEVARSIGSYGTDRVRAAVFAAAVPPYLYQAGDNPDGGLADSDITGMEEALSADRAGFFDGFTTAFFSAGDELKVGEEDRLEALRLIRQADETATLECVGAFSRTDFRSDLERVSVPTLVIHGDSDGIVPFEVSGQRTAAAIPDSQVVLISEGPHGIITSHPDEFNTALLDFLADS